MSKLRLLIALSLAAAPAALIGAPATKEQLLVPPPGARHYTISSIAGKHGDNWSWTLPGGRTAYRMSMSMRGWITEDDEVVTAGADGLPTRIAIRGFTDDGDATEDYSVGADGVAIWKTAVDGGTAPLSAKRYSSYGGPWLAGEQDIAAFDPFRKFRFRRKLDRPRQAPRDRTNFKKKPEHRSLFIINDFQPTDQRGLSRQNALGP